MKTEAEVYRAIVRRFAAPAYAVLPGVANGTGSGKRRTVDAIIMSLWPSRGLTLEGVEIKTSRRDWLREMKDPAKQEPIIKFCDRFWLAVGDAAIVEEGEVPTTWGLLVPGNAGKMRIAKHAPDLTPQPISRGFLAAIFRRANEAVENDEIRQAAKVEAKAELATEMDALRDRAMPRDVERKIARLRELEEQVGAFERLAGVRFARWPEGQVERAAKIVRQLNDADRVIARTETALVHALGSLNSAVDALRSGRVDEVDA